jgi:chromosome segregation ATPase
MDIENNNDELIEEEEGEVDLEAELVSALSELKKVRRECKQFKREIESLDQELQKSNNLIENTEIMLVDLKLKIEEARVTKEALNNVLAEKDKENAGLKLEVVLLRKKVQENNMNHSSQVSDQIICSQISTYDKIGIGYKSEVTNTSSSSSFEKAGTKHTNEKNTYKQKG